MTTIQVLGLGNVLMGDDGVGPYVVQALDATYVCPERVSFLEVGTPGLDLVPYIDDADLLIVVDTVRAPGRPGEVRLYRCCDPMSTPDRPRLGPHEPGLEEALAGLHLSGRGPREVLLVGVTPRTTTTGIGLSPEVRAAIPAAVEIVARELVGRGASLIPREPRMAPDIWWERSRADQPAPGRV